MRQLRLYTESECLVSPVVLAVAAVPMWPAMVCALHGSFEPGLIAAAFSFWCVIAHPQLLDHPTCSRVDRAVEEWAAALIEVSAALRTRVLAGLPQFRRIAYINGAAVGTLWVASELGLAGAESTVIHALGLPGVAALGAMIIVFVFALPFAVASHIIEPLLRTCRSGPLRETPVLTAAEIAVRLRGPAGTAAVWLCLLLSLAFAVAPALVGGGHA